MMATCDTSVLIPALVSWHVSHEEARAALVDIETILAHVLIETYSVLTRLPGAQRLDALTAAAAVKSLPWKVITLPGSAHASLLSELAAHHLTGGAGYDALVGATARAHDLTLLSRDRRAQRTYDALRVRSSMV